MPTWRPRLCARTRFCGWIVAPIDLRTLSEIARDLSKRFETTAFILDGDDRILAHEHLLAPRAAKWRGDATIRLTQFDDPVLARYVDRKPIHEFLTANPADVEIAEIDTQSDPNSELRLGGGSGYIVITKKSAGYGVRPWTVGAYFTRWEVGQEILRAWVSAALGMALLAVALVAAVILGKRLSRPIKMIAAQANLVADFDLDHVKPLPRSRVLEFDQQATAFNGMLAGLKAFSAYVPRSLVAKLVRTGDVDAARPREAILTVMFTDIAGFTSLSRSCLPTRARSCSIIISRCFAMRSTPKAEQSTSFWATA